jgi:hypothetical protein
MVHRGLGAHHNLPPVRQLQQFRVCQRIQCSPATLALAASHSS